MSTEQPHPITLDSLVFTKCLVEAIPDHEPAEPNVLIHPVNNITVGKVPGEIGGWVATISSIFNVDKEKTAPYHFDMQCMGIFHADDSLTEAEALRGVTITANNVLYGAIRESVAWLTGRQPYGPLILGLSVLRNNKSASKEIKPSDAPSQL